MLAAQPFVVSSLFLWLALGLVASSQCSPFGSISGRGDGRSARAFLLLCQVFEKYHKIFVEPQADMAEQKIIESCKAVKAINPKTDCYIYVRARALTESVSLGVPGVPQNV